ncbi:MULTISPECIES: ribosome biogenesis GTPase Der [unclassified Roseitalea]|uniref:ribosome biogenesis GTPase Der n=1 Tax=unclassified Roseitalea TaxID=2639107 RepID=UPI00273FC8CA|nr:MULTISPECIES: ribosome biogenesis GTPase Der [unclassified Roseitalea]
MAFTIAIVGRPNVGKSTLFNRLVGRRVALVHDEPGVTRDRRRHEAALMDLQFDVIDTAGLEEGDAASLPGRMRAQTEIAIEEADLIVFMIDARAGLTAADRTFADLLRRSGRPVVLVANKVEARAAETGLYDAYELGLGEAVPVSAEHGLGLSDLRDAIVAAVGEDRAFGAAAGSEGEEAETDIDVDDTQDEDVEVAYDETRPLRIAIVGRPNAGKSTLINRLVGEDRLLTGPEAGITRDSISVDWQWQGRKVRLFDTAGMRRKARVVEKLERLSVGDALRAIRFAEVVVVVLDALVPFEKQDLQIIDLIAREGRAPVIAFNKWDLVKDRQALLNELRAQTERLLPQIRGVRAVPVSAVTGRGLDRLMEEIVATHKVWNSRISTGRLNRWLDAVAQHHPPPAVSGRRIRLKYITQAKTRPPGFVLSCSRPEALPRSYVRYLTNALREDFELAGVPIRLMLRAPANPYAHKAKTADRRTR